MLVTPMKSEKAFDINFQSWLSQLTLFLLGTALPMLLRRATTPGRRIHKMAKRRCLEKQRQRWTVLMSSCGNRLRVS